MSAFAILIATIFATGCTKEEKIIEPKTATEPKTTQPVDIKDVLKDDLKTEDVTTKASPDSKTTK